MRASDKFIRDEVERQGFDLDAADVFGESGGERDLYQGLGR